MAIFRSIGNHLKWDVDATISVLGGYWPPLAALARLTEELGELSKELSREDPATGALGKEIADSLIITTCIANQYSVNLAKAYEASKFHEVLTRTHPTAKATGHELFAALSTLAGELSRTLNAYEGPKKPKEGEALRSVGPIVGDIHGYLCRLAINLAVSLDASVNEVLEVSRQRDRGRFEQQYDPANNHAIGIIRRLQQRTQCPFADEARMWGSPGWKAGDAIPQFIDRVVPPLTRFCRIAPMEGLDGFGIVLPASSGRTLNQLGHSVNLTLRHLSACDPSGEKCMDGNILQPGWHFRFAANDFFVAAFAPCYPETSARYAFGIDGTVILLQPESSFKGHGLKKNEETNSLRKRIRELYRIAGRPYDSEIIAGNLEAPRYVKPLRVGDPMVEWWSM